MKKEKKNPASFTAFLSLINSTFRPSRCAQSLPPFPSPACVPPPNCLSPSRLPLCVAASSEECLILPLSAAPRQKRRRAGGGGGGVRRPFCLSSRRSGVPPLCSALTHALQSCSLFIPFFFPFFLARGAALAPPPPFSWHWRTSQTPFPCEF